MNDFRRSPPLDYRRAIVGGASALLLIVGGYLKYSGQSTEFLNGPLGRIGIFLAVVFIAWPSLRRPMSWLPPGIAGIILIGMMVLAARPRLVAVVLPAIAILTTAGFVVRIFKKAN
jgi:hypothetical protein